MGVRGELFSTKVALQNRTYFFNVKENRLGDLYLNIVESKNRDEGGFDRQSVILFAEDLQEFLQGFDESLKVLEKAVREKRRGPNKRERPASWDKPPEEGGEETKPARRSFKSKKFGEDSQERYAPPSRSRFPDRAPREGSLRERTPRERSLRERTPRERTSRERPVRERSIRERPVRERPDRERPVRERPSRDKPQWDKSEGFSRGPGRREYRDKDSGGAFQRKKKVVVRKR